MNTFISGADPRSASTPTSPTHLVGPTKARTTRDHGTHVSASTKSVVALASVLRHKSAPGITANQ